MQGKPALAKPPHEALISTMPKTGAHTHLGPRGTSGVVSHATFKHVAAPARLVDILRAHRHTESSARALRAKLEQTLKREHAVAG